MSRFEYCAVIRTLGKAGKAYQTLLDGLVKQTIKPKKILVYIPDGYELPRETVGVEEYIRSPKGMIAQRSLQFSEADTDYILFCDDDLSLETDAVERLFKIMKDRQADCVIPETFHPHKMTIAQKIFGMFHSGQLPHWNKRYNIKIRKDGAYSYFIHPKDDSMPTQSGAGTCCLCRKIVYDAIHFEDEQWLDCFRYASGDDQLFYYKMYISGYKLETAFHSGVTHLDARSAGRPDIRRKQFYQKEIAFIIWYRTQYNRKGANKVKCVAAFAWRCLMGMCFCPVEAVFYRHLRFIPDFFRGLYAGYNYVHSDAYKSIPKYDAYI